VPTNVLSHYEDQRIYEMRRGMKNQIKRYEEAKNSSPRILSSIHTPRADVRD
jgi:hypothetical protein